MVGPLRGEAWWELSHRCLLTVVVWKRNVISRLRHLNNLYLVVCGVSGWFDSSAFLEDISHWRPTLIWKASCHFQFALSVLYFQFQRWVPSFLLLLPWYPHHCVFNSSGTISQGKPFSLILLCHGALPQQQMLSRQKL